MFAHVNRSILLDYSTLNLYFPNMSKNLFSISKHAKYANMQMNKQDDKVDLNHMPPVYDWSYLFVFKELTCKV